MGNNSINYLRMLNKHIKIKALSVLCGYSDDVIRAILRKNSITHRQIMRIHSNLVPWVEAILDGIQDLEEDIQNS